MSFTCEICDYFTEYAFNYSRHLNSKKHINMISKIHEEEKILKNTQNVSISSTKNHKNPQLLKKLTQNTTIFTQKTTKNHNFTQNTQNSLIFPQKNMFICEFCNKEFTRKDSMKRHIKNTCKLKKENETITELTCYIKEQQEKNDKEKEKLYNYIDKLIEKSGNTINIGEQNNQSNHIDNQTFGNQLTNNLEYNQTIENNQKIESISNTNNIKLNNFGEEDISHITDEFKMKMLTLPYGMVQQMVEKVHFNKKKPENKNIALTNKRENMIKVFRRKKWKYQDRSYVVDEIIKNNYNRLDEYFEEHAKLKMTPAHNRRYLLFQKKFDRQDEELMKRIKRETEMILLSENL